MLVRRRPAMRALITWIPALVLAGCGSSSTAPPPSDAGAVQDAPADVASPSGQYVAFVSSATYSGDLKDAAASGSGLAGADALCQQLATKAGLKGTFSAWLSDAATNAIDRIHDVQGGWYTAGSFPRKFADSKAALVANGPLTQLGDENGNPAPVGAGAVCPWTGSKPDGTVATAVGDAGGDATCADWTTTSTELGAAGGIGKPSNGSNIAIGCTVRGGVTYASCASKQPIYCFQQ